VTEAQARAIFLLAGIEVMAIFKTENNYWPTSYVEERQASPWWLVKTSAGLVHIGWRKRVISINWEDTKVREVITEDEVTKEEHMVHAYNYAKAVEYMTRWRRIAETEEPSHG
jgi:hypothetical protein